MTISTLHITNPSSITNLPIIPSFFLHLFDRTVSVYMASDFTSSVPPSTQSPSVFPILAHDSSFYSDPLTLDPLADRLSSSTRITNIISTHPRAFLSGLSDQASFDVIFDSGASCSVTHDLADFIGDLQPSSDGKVLGGIANGLPILGTGDLNWVIGTAASTFLPLRHRALYVPSAG